MTNTSYIHGTSAEEQARLTLMNDILNGRCLEAVAPGVGERVLDLGAGTGLFARELARAVVASGNRGAVVAVERDEDQLATARRMVGDTAGLELRLGDAYAPPLVDDEWGTFDLVHARFLLEHLERPDDAVAVMVRAVRPGGRIVLVDDDHDVMRFWPDPGGMSELFDDYARAYAHLGHDAYVGRKLPALLSKAGARLLRTAVVHYGSCAGEPNFPAVVDNLVRVVHGARESIAKHGDWTAADVDATLARFQAWSREPGATVWYALPVAVGTVD